jgi:hypothetical protein
LQRSTRFSFSTEAAPSIVRAGPKASQLSTLYQSAQRQPPRLGAN